LDVVDEMMKQEGERMEEIGKEEKRGKGKEKERRQLKKERERKKRKRCQSGNGGSATLQKAVAERSVSFCHLCYSKVTVSTAFVNLTLNFFSENQKKL
jgi:hypothetical protein